MTGGLRMKVSVAALVMAAAAVSTEPAWAEGHPANGSAGGGVLRREIEGLRDRLAGVERSVDRVRERVARIEPGGASDGPIDVNTADAAALRTLEGVGASLARRIVENRPYEGMADLLRVPGVESLRVGSVIGRVEFSEVEGGSRGGPGETPDAAGAEETAGAGAEEDEDEDEGAGGVPATGPGSAEVPGVPMAVNLSSVSAHTASWPFANVLRQIKWKKRGDMRSGALPTVGGRPMGWPRYAGAQGRTLYDLEHYPAGTYTAVWEGRGRISFTEWGDDVAAQRRIGDHRMEIDVVPGSGDGIRLDILETDPADPVRDVRLWLPGVDVAAREALHAATGFGGFSPDLLERLRPFRAVRFMDWQRTNNSEEAEWEDRPKLDARSWHDGAVPLEVIYALADEARVDPWLCVPHRASDGHVRRMAEMARERLHPERRVYVEYSNECWNWNFDQADWCLQRGLALGLGRGKAARDRYYARRAGKVFALWEEVFGGENRDRLTFVLSSQAWSPPVSERILATGAAEPAMGSADALAIAPYFKALGLQPGASASDVLDAAETNLEREGYRGDLRRHAELAAEHGLGLLAYEGGPSLLPQKALKGVDFESGAEREAAERAMLATMIEASARPRMHDLIARMLEIWRDAGGGLFAYYSLADTWGKSGMWGSLQWLTQPVGEAPKYRAIVEAAGRNPKPETRN